MASSQAIAAVGRRLRGMTMIAADADGQIENEDGDQPPRDIEIKDEHPFPSAGSCSA